MNAVTEKRLALLEETRRLYFGPDFEPLPARSIIEIKRKDGLTSGDIQCRYQCEDGRRCAIGRLMTDEELDQVIEGRGILDRTNEHLIGPIAKRHGIEGHMDTIFIGRLQMLHDSARGGEAELEYESIKDELLNGKL